MVPESFLPEDPLGHQNVLILVHLAISESFLPGAGSSLRVRLGRFSLSGPRVVSPGVVGSFLPERFSVVSPDAMGRFSL